MRLLSQYPHPKPFKQPKVMVVRKVRQFAELEWREITQRYYAFEGVECICGESLFVGIRSYFKSPELRFNEKSFRCRKCGMVPLIRPEEVKLKFRKTWLAEWFGWTTPEEAGTYK